jgi:hypothetical protein
MARENPKSALEGDLAIAALGLVIVVFGSLVVAGGLYGGSNPSAPSSPHPLLGTIIFVVGAGVILLGLVLGVANVAVYLSARRRSRQHRD